METSNSSQSNTPSLPRLSGRRQSNSTERRAYSSSTRTIINTLSENDNQENENLLQSNSIQIHRRKNTLTPKQHLVDLTNKDNDDPMFPGFISNIPNNRLVLRPLAVTRSADPRMFQSIQTVAVTESSSLSTKL